jgi:putative colanic acid biosynthesis acetyltransferase WcaB
MNWLVYVSQDTKLNNNMKAKFVLVNFRICQTIVRSPVSSFLLFPFLVLYRLIVEWLMGIELNWNLNIGPVRIFHGQGLVINPGTLIASGCTFRCNTVVGDKVSFDGTKSACPRIGNNVDVGANSCIIGGISIGNNVAIGAGSVVVKDVPDNCIVAGNPAKIIRKIVGL